MTVRPTIRDLLAFGDITSIELDDAVKAYLRDPTIGQFLLGDGLRINLKAAVHGNAHAMAILRDRTSRTGARRYVVRRALLDARPE
ncbi:hypothetical protein E4V01_24305 [Methylorubrum sp. Q1]|uniref:hypothetical protein n=1 Tax=Methylorubrum sp. Q1 TaxID=2562453 RepID=UPI0010763ECC|nr:hypothetical protein [Methylorubrum sp. Q1]TFZ54925.1 hypothetical protein E4V01_24305 [Methylorubrum sp. Q1]